MANLFRVGIAVLTGHVLVSSLIMITMLIKLENKPTLKHWGRAVKSDKTRPKDSTSLDREKGKDNHTSAESDNIERVRHLRRECKQYSDKVMALNYLDHLIVDENYKTVFCYIPKISCSQWKTIFITLTGKVNASKLNLGNVHKEYRSAMNLLSEYSFEGRKRILKEYKKYVIVRNPFERILSAYRNKFAGKGSMYFRNIGRNIIKLYRFNATVESLQKGDDVTFLEFVQFLINDKPKRYDSHWQRYTTLCNPCIVKYDFVGKYETISRDAAFILKDIGAPPEIRFPNRSERYGHVETIKTFDTFYSQIPAKYIEKLLNIYQSDFKLFGYSITDNFKKTPHS